MNPWCFLAGPSYVADELEPTLHEILETSKVVYQILTIIESTNNTFFLLPWYIY